MVVAMGVAYAGSELSAEDGNFDTVEPRWAVEGIDVNALSMGAKDHAILIADPSQAWMLELIGQSYHGILGRTFLERFLVTLDYQADAAWELIERESSHRPGIPPKKKGINSSGTATGPNRGVFRAGLAD